MDTSKVDQDVSGTQISFEVRAGKLFGFIRLAEGQIGFKRPLQRMHFDSRTGTVTFIHVIGSERSVFEYHVSCERLTGTARLYVTAQDTGVLVRDTLTRSVPITRP